MKKTSMNKNNIIFFKFNMNEILFIGSINLRISVDVITFHVVLVNVSFFLCLVDLNHLRFYFQNLINMFIKKQFKFEKILSRKEIYFD
jgi:hypothetical protein